MQHPATSTAGSACFGGQVFVNQKQKGIQLGVLQCGVAHCESLLGLGGLRRLPLGDRLIKILEGVLPLSAIEVGIDRKAGLGAGGTDELENLRVAAQGLGSPV